MDYTKDGFINLESIYRNRSKYLNKIIIPNDLCGPHYNGYWLKMDNQTYFLKIPNTLYDSTKIKREMFCELLGEELARLIGIQTIESNLAMLNSQSAFYGILSKSYLKSDEDIYSGRQIVEDYLTYLEKVKDPLTNKNSFYEYFGYQNQDIMFDKISEGKLKYYYNSLEFIWASLEYHFKERKNKKEIVEGIMQKLTKRYIFQFILMQKDYHLANWEIAESDNGAYLVPQYDMDMSFSTTFTNESRNNSMRSEMPKVNDIYEDIRRFYNTSSSEFQNEFNRQINLLTEDVIASCIAKIAKKYNLDIPPISLAIYSEHRRRILSLIESPTKER